MGTLNQRASLPKWAQRDLERLESNVEHYKAKFTALNQPGGRIIVNPYSEGSSFALDADTRIEYRLGEAGDDLGPSISVKLVKGRDDSLWLDVHASGTYLTISPRSSNAVEVRGDSR